MLKQKIKSKYFICVYNKVLPFKAVEWSSYPIISITLPMSAKSDYKGSKTTWHMQGGRSASSPYRHPIVHDHWAIAWAAHSIAAVKYCNY